jgi:hypothetical protein
MDRFAQRVAFRVVRGRYGPFDPVPRWRHYASLQWENGPWRATVAQTFQSGYVDADPDVNGNPRRVGSYSLRDLQGAYTGWRNTTLTLGVKNLSTARRRSPIRRTRFGAATTPITAIRAAARSTAG